jgi:AcrR family transcriptional regulator
VLIDSDIHTAALTVIAEHGIDEMGIPQVAAAAGVTSAPVYRRFDSADDIVSELWSTVLRQQFARSARAALTWNTNPGETDWLSNEIIRPSLESQALIETLCASRRLGPAGATIRSEFEHDLNEIITSAPHLPPVLVLATISPVLGALLLGPLTPAFPAAVVSSFPQFINEYSRTEHWALESSDVPYVAPPPLQWSTGESALDDLRLAAVHVMGRFGVANATVNRITRRAGRSVNTAYRRLGSKNDLVAEAVSMALNSEFGFSGQENATSMPFGRADRVARSLQVLRNHIDERNLAHRSFLLEALLAARHQSTVKVSVTEWFTRVADRFSVGASALGLDDTAELHDVWRHRIVAGIGSLVLSLTSSQFTTRYDPLPAVSANDAVLARLLRTNA